MMGGIPVICAFNAPDTLIREYNCGYQCDPDDEDAVIGAILELSRMTDEERKLIGEKGRKAILEKYTYEKLAEAFINCI